MKVFYTTSVNQYLDDLVDILYFKNYFGFEESAIKYVDNLTGEIEKTIHLRIRNIAPTYFLKYGKDLHYTTYLKNKNTTWYIFFTYHPKDICHQTYHEQPCGRTFIGVKMLFI